MAHLTLTGVSDDGKCLLLVSPAGVEFTVDIDPRLRAAVRGERSRQHQQGPGHLEMKMDSTLRPRDIQARIRAGETPEAVAEAAQTSVDRIMAFAAPVMAERAHAADRAQRSSVRRRAGDPGSVGGARTLGEAVGAHLRGQNIDPDTVEWDAWRREDGRWTLTGEFSATRRSGSATFTYDGPGNYVTAENDDARWLIGESLPIAQTDEVRDDLRRARERRLTPVGEDELPLGDDAIELVSEPAPAVRPDPEQPVDTEPTPVRTRPSAGDDRFGADQPLEAFLDVEPAPAAEAELREDAADAAALDTGPDDAPDADADPGSDTGPDAEPEPETPRRPVRKSRGRASVPSWDEIMFGGGKND